MNCSQEDLDSASPEIFVDSTDPPTFLAHGRDDCTVPETFDYVGNGNVRQMLDYYEITGLPSQQLAEFSSRGLAEDRPVIVFLHGGAWVLGHRGGC